MGQFSSTQICSTDACINTGANVLMNLAPHWRQLDPCTNFEEMVCYGYRETHAESTTAGQDIGGTNTRALRRILEGSYQDATQFISSRLGARANVDEFNFNMLKQSYQACMNTDAIVKQGVTPLFQFARQVTTGWPVSAGDLNKTPAAADLDSFAKASVALGKAGILPWQLTTLGDPFESTVTLPALAGMALASKTYTDYSDQTKLEAFFALYNTTLSQLYPALNATIIEEIARGIVDFEAEIGKAIAGPAAADAEKIQKGADPITASFKRVSFSELATLAPELRLDKILLELMPAGYTPKNILLGQSYSWPIISATVKKQPVAVLQGWIAAKAATFFAEEVLAAPLSPEARDARWSKCVEFVVPQLKYVVDRFFYAHTMSDLGRDNALKMTKNIKAEFKKRLNKYLWMGQEAKQRAIKKVDNMIEEVGYQSQEPNVMLPDSLATYYSALNVTDDHISNLFSTTKFLLKVSQDKVAKPANRREWVRSTSIANAGYNRMLNAIFIHAGISRTPFFHADLPQYAQYGALGSIIGHEVTHGFDSIGSKWDENGNFQQWWDNATITAFDEKTQCFVDQYNKFQVEVGDGKKMPANGLFTLGENLSDAAGVSLAYDAWQNERKLMPDVWDQHLPGLEEFTHEQLFFIMFGNTWCSAQTDSKRLELLLGDEHALNKHRVLGVTSNTRAFKDAFKCKKKEPECELW
ncbi:hypothetical protein QBC38DRAFT_505697 [Podospora fimiseda]|uniref:Uncharacterized protein n=1 Tax=Podospora fimiseda TaxID=252190 RepID=A0AAN6YM10_9PEZI|nr:hypothetical protein QBC38DRAFT_505697 [Podospora fimiseda]